MVVRWGLEMCWEAVFHGSDVTVPSTPHPSWAISSFTYGISSSKCHIEAQFKEQFLMEEERIGRTEIQNEKESWGEGEV